jgi:hypothetical protein
MYTIQFHAGTFEASISTFVADHYYAVGHFQFESRENLAKEIADEDAAFASQSVIACAVDDAGELLSTLRLIVKEDSGRPLPTERAFELHLPNVTSAGNQVQRTMELARMASSPRCERGIVWILAAGLYQYAHLDPKVDLVAAAIDARLLRALGNRGWPVHAIGAPRFHVGSLTVPIVVDLHGTQPLMERWGLARAALQHLKTHA